MKQPKSLSENFIKQSIVTWLFRHRWGRNMQAKELHQLGVDIRVRHNQYARYFVIEVKGNGARPQSNEVGFIYGLGQIITRMNVSQARYYYGIGLPKPAADIALRRLPWQVAKHLLLYVFSVDHTGKVTQYSWKELKRLQIK